jgi:2-polyprenyl-3-methyl-5-hydroxy-6-metoxy-1,4-benzoquinol methylase
MGRHERTDVAYHRTRAATYDRDITTDFGVYDDLVLPWVFDHLSRLPGTRALDLGCGTGSLTVLLARQGLTVEALDHSPDMLAVARSKTEAEGLSGSVTFSEGDIRSIPLPDASFDVVTCQRVLHHVAEADAVISEVARVLKPGGVFYLSDQVLDEAPLVARLKRLWRIVGRKPQLDEHDAFLREHEVHWRPEELLALLDDCGFTYKRRSFGHVGLQTAVPPAVRRRLIWLLSFPWRRGDMLFVVAVLHAAS